MPFVAISVEQKLASFRRIKPIMMTDSPSQRNEALKALWVGILNKGKQLTQEALGKPIIGDVRKAQVK
jgi:hypothetical protein